MRLAGKRVSEMLDFVVNLKSANQHRIAGKASRYKKAWSIGRSTLQKLWTNQRRQELELVDKRREYDGEGCRNATQTQCREQQQRQSRRDQHSHRRFR